MQRAEEKIRNYNGSDAEMIQSSRIMHGLFIADKQSFTEFDSTFSDPFADIWLAKINSANEVAQDSTAVSELTTLTKRVEDKMNEGKEFYQSMKYFIEKAFPDKKEIWVQFGSNDYENARKSEIRMIQFLGILDKTARQYSQNLIDAGFSQEKINKIKTLQIELTDADYDQEMSKKKRPTLTQERITTLNECYEFMKKVSKAGKIIFSNNFVKYNQYMLPHEETTAKKETQTDQTQTNK
jgi:hypothetical protein